MVRGIFEQTLQETEPGSAATWRVERRLPYGRPAAIVQQAKRIDRMSVAHMEPVRLGSGQQIEAGILPICRAPQLSY
jgi:hypothetical protein